jgi:hypothetical protein
VAGLAATWLLPTRVPTGKPPAEHRFHHHAGGMP